MKTADLIGPALDWAVAKCEKEAVVFARGAVRYKPGQFSDEAAYTPSTDWTQGGLVIDREDIALGHGNHGEAPEHRFSASKLGTQPWAVMAEGPSKLIAAMRCYVASKRGDEVDVPQELL